MKTFLICAASLLTFTQAASAQDATLNIRSNFIGYSDVVESCQQAMKTEYHNCHKLNCWWAEQNCLRILTEIEPSAGEEVGADSGVYVNDNQVTVIQTEHNE